MHCIDLYDQSVYITPRVSSLFQHLNYNYILILPDFHPDSHSDVHPDSIQTSIEIPQAIRFKMRQSYVPVLFSLSAMRVIADDSSAMFR